MKNFFKPDKPHNHCKPHEHCCPEPDMPQFCPPPQRPPVPCMPPVPSVVEGNSLYEAVNNLTNRVNICINTYNDVMHNCYETLHNLERAAEENGAYYSPCDVWTEQGYYADESATYTLIHKNVVDRHGEPIRVKLHLAYGNTTNSKIEQNLASASKITYADKIVVAIPKGENGWYGNAIWNGAPIKTSDAPDLYTVGFTKSGVMRVYQNSVCVDQMLRDTIVDAMGCSGVLIQNGQITDDSYQLNIPNRTEQVARIIMGQNLDTREVIFLVCGNENDVNRKGLTSKAAANILLQYGCDIAVELAESASAGAMDKGSLMFVPDNDTIPDAYAFWYISRKRFYKNDYQRELAELMQNYGACIWQTYLNKNRIDDLRTDLENEIQNRIDGDETLQNNIDAEEAARKAADEQLQKNIDAEVARAQAAEKALDDKIEAETTRAEEAEAALDSKINQEISRSTAKDTEHDQKITALEQGLDKEIHDRTNADATLHQEILTEQGERIAADKQLQTNINTEASTRAQADQTLQSNIDALSSRVTQIQNDLNELNTLYQTLQEQVAAYDEAITSMQTTISSIETSLNNVKTTIEDLRGQISNIVNGTTALPYLPLAGGTMTGAINMGGQSLTNLATPSGNQDAATKKYVDDAISGSITPPTGDYLPLSGGQMSGNIAMANNRVTGLGTPTDNSDAVPKSYLDTAVSTAGDGKFVPLAGGTMTGALTLSGNPTQNLQAATKQYVDAADATINSAITNITNGTTVLPYVKKSGDTMTGALTLSGDPTQNLQAATKQYVDSAVAGVPTPDLSPYLLKAGGTMTGDLVLAGDPTLANEAANKNYVDNAISGVQQQVNTNATNIANITNGTTALPYVKSVNGSGTGTHTFENINISGDLTVDSVDVTTTITVPTPSDGTDAANKAYVDQQTAKYVPIAGGTMTGALTLAADPTQNMQAATKQYVDNNTGYSKFVQTATDNGTNFTFTVNVEDVAQNVLNTQFTFSFLYGAPHIVFTTDIDPTSTLNINDWVEIEIRAKNTTGQAIMNALAANPTFNIDNTYYGYASFMNPSTSPQRTRYTSTQSATLTFLTATSNGIGLKLFATLPTNMDTGESYSGRITFVI